MTSQLESRGLTPAGFDLEGACNACFGALEADHRRIQVRQCADALPTLHYTAWAEPVPNWSIELTKQ
jgi:hypothetical protein